MPKNLLTRVGETIDQYRAEQAQSPRRNSPSTQRLRWFLPSGGTALVVLLPIATQSVCMGESPPKRANHL